MTLIVRVDFLEEGMNRYRNEELGMGIENIDVRSIIAPKDAINHWDTTTSDENYHANRTAINSSSLKYALRSEYAFFQVFFQKKPTKQTESMRYGTLAHMALLEGRKFQERHIVIPDFGDLRSSTNREKRAKWIQEIQLEIPNAVFVKNQEEYDNLIAVVESILSHKEASKLFSNGQPEAMGWYTDPRTGLRCRMKADFLSFNVNCLLDFKTARDVRWEKFKWAVEDYRYDFQIEMYADGTFQINQKQPDHKLWVVIENQYPFEMAIYEVDDVYQAAGKYEYEKALKNIRKAVDSNIWPKEQKSIEYSEPSIGFVQKYQLHGVI